MKIIYSLLIAFALVLGGCAGKTKTEDGKKVSNITEEESSMAESYYKLGMAYINTPNDHIAYQNFEKALEIDPANPKYIYSKGLFYLKRDQLVKAEDEIFKAISMDPKEAEFRNTYAILLVKKGMVDKAIENWKIAVNDPTYPHHIMVYYNMAKTLYDVGRYDEVEQYIMKAFGINRLFSQGYDLLYGSYMKMGDNKKAEKLLLKTVEYFPESMRMKLRLGAFYYQVGRYSDAVPLFEEVLEKDADSKYGKEAVKYMKKLGLIYE